MRIAIAVHGRFHAFDLARELIRSGEDVTVLTNYPKYIAARFGIPVERVQNNVLHGVVSRVAGLIGRVLDRPFLEPLMHKWFSRWAAGVLRRTSVDVIHSFSGVSEEIFKTVPSQTCLRTLMRGSAHICEQDEILAQEEARTGERAYRPSPWMVSRELREYALADLIIVLSPFAYDSFVARGIPKEKLRLLLLGTQLKLFRPTYEKSHERALRIRKGEPLRILTVGTFSLRKGASDLVEVAQATGSFASVRFVGTVVPRAKRIAARTRNVIDFISKVSQFELARQYEWGDVFLFPTLEDGYAVVLAQAVAAGLPVLASRNCAAPVLVTEGENGWLFPIRRPDLVIERLEWCNMHRDRLAEIADRTYKAFVPRDWSNVARDFAVMCNEVVGR